MTTFDYAPPAVRAAWRAHQDALAATLPRLAFLAQLDVGPASHPLRDDAGRLWRVTRLDVCDYLASTPGLPILRGTATELARMMEGE